MEHIKPILAIMLLWSATNYAVGKLYFFNNTPHILEVRLPNINKTEYVQPGANPVIAKFMLAHQCRIIVSKNKLDRPEATEIHISKDTTEDGIIATENDGKISLTLVNDES